MSAEPLLWAFAFAAILSNLVGHHEVARVIAFAGFVIAAAWLVDGVLSDD